MPLFGLITADKQPIKMGFYYWHPVHGWVTVEYSGSLTAYQDSPDEPSHAIRVIPRRDAYRGISIGVNSGDLWRYPENWEKEAGFYRET